MIPKDTFCPIAKCECNPRCSILMDNPSYPDGFRCGLREWVNQLSLVQMGVWDVGSALEDGILEVMISDNRESFDVADDKDD